MALDYGVEFRASSVNGHFNDPLKPKSPNEETPGTHIDMSKSYQIKDNMDISWYKRRKILSGERDRKIEGGAKLVQHMIDWKKEAVQSGGRIPTFARHWGTTYLSSTNIPLAS